nr:hypothetical protein [Nitrosomonas nitrosa]
MKKLLITATVLSVAAASPAHATITEWALSFERFLGGLKVYDRQVSASEQQTQQVTKKSAEAMANAEMTQELAYKIAETKQRYSYETGQGDSACLTAYSREGLTGVSSSQKRVRQAFSSAESGYISRGGNAADVARNSILKRVGYYCTDVEQAKLGSTYCQSDSRSARDAGDSNAAPFLVNRTYGAAEAVAAADYIDVLAPFPTINPNASTASDQINLVKARLRATVTTGARAAMMRVVGTGMGGDK